MGRIGRGGPGRRLVAAVSRHSLRVVGAVTILLSIGVTAVSIATDHGLAVSSEATSRSVSVAAEAGALTALVEFTLAHPAYPVAAVVGFFLVVVGENAPLIGS